MYTYQHPRPALTVDIVPFSLREAALQVLLVRRGSEPYQGCWALPGGFVNIDEALEDAAQRELAEETGLQAAYLEQLYTYGDPQRDPRGRVVSVAYYALVASGVAAGAASREAIAGDDASAVAWFDIADLPELAFDHTEIVAYAVRRLRYKLEYSAVGFELLPPEFTLGELQAAYEIVLGERLDKRNFRRRILQAGVIEASRGKRSGEGRPAQLYRYRDDAVAEVKARRLFP